ncbi:hypothetical protein [Orbus mooreae]|uniref:hypothetical protein n=1 Tax=Orbus mooreae TaxID=3074107 RepID=UPI00370D2961
MFQAQNLIAPESVLFSLYYPYLLGLKNSSHAPHQLANHYLAKVTRKSARIRKKNGYVGNTCSHAITALIRGESLKSMTASSVIQGGITLLKLSEMAKKQLPTISAKQLMLYGLRLRFVMAIAILCHVDLHQAETRQQLLQLMQRVPIVEWDLPYTKTSLIQRLQQSYNKGDVDLLPTNKPWLTCLRFISTLTLDGMVTYRLGLSAHKQLSQDNLWTQPPTRLKAG